MRLVLVNSQTHYKESYNCSAKSPKRFIKRTLNYYGDHLLLFDLFPSKFTHNFFFDRAKNALELEAYRLLY
jgi:hypothetical protein